jgi:tRNA threonylcarbamoyladenosine modification (KEOPS) complex Cgi121 subunit
MIVRKVNSAYVVLEVVKLSFTNNRDKLEVRIKKALDVLERADYGLLVPVRCIAGIEQILAAANMLIKGCYNRRISKHGTVEFLLRVLGKTQVKEALKLATVTKRDRYLIVVAICRKPQRSKVIVRAARRVLGKRASTEIIKRCFEKAPGKYARLFGVEEAAKSYERYVHGVKESIVEKVVLTSG